MNSTTEQAPIPRRTCPWCNKRNPGNWRCRWCERPITTHKGGMVEKRVAS